MAKSSVDNKQSSLRWYIKLSKWLWSKRSFVWGTVILNIILGIIVTLLFTSPSTLTQLPIGWAFQNFALILLIFVVLLSFTIILGLISHLPYATSDKVLDTTSDKVLENRYLMRMIRETEMLRLTGIPAMLTAPSVPLEVVFIPLEFFPKRLAKDYPLSDEEYSKYHELLKRGLLSEEMQRVFIGKEGEWEKTLKKGERISIHELWQLIDRNEPAVVVQGYPGMGKSTLMARLILHFARVRLRQLDENMGAALETTDTSPIPILLLLKDFAAELSRTADQSPALSIIDYMKIAVERRGIPELFQFLQQQLSEGHCLVILDGLDEVSDLHLRKKVKEAIEIFVLNYRDCSSIHFNRFIITSRVAGYDLVAFTDYSHFTVAELTIQQIESFLPRWCRASIKRSSSSQLGASEVVIKEADDMARALIDAVKTHTGVSKLAQNPLLLTLLAVMQQNSIALPRQRIELYTAVTRTLLENRNLAKDLEPIHEAQAIQRLGPIAFEMQEKGNYFARPQHVKESLAKIIERDGGTPAEIEQEVENFLIRIRERGGLFVIRTGDYFGFFHRTFQEYFAARYILNQIKIVPDKWIMKLVELGQQADDLWRETFLLAVAYQSGEDEIIAQRIISLLLETPQRANFKDQIHDLLLAVECLIESKPLTIGSELESKIAKRLLQVYDEVSCKEDINSYASKIEMSIADWLISLPKEAYRPALLVVLTDAIVDARDIKKQRNVLTLLSMIADNLKNSSPIVFDTLVPSLLGLTSLPAFGTYKPILLQNTPDMKVAELASTVLTFIGKRGPARLLLPDVRQYFKENPESLRLLARYSLECRTLLSLTGVPWYEEGLDRYLDGINRWISLRNQLSPTAFSVKDIDDCLSILQILLDTAVEMIFPATIPLLAMLRLSAASLSQPWEQVWQGYILLQMRSETYEIYQLLVLLWLSLFNDSDESKILASAVLADFQSSSATLRNYAQRLIAQISIGFLGSFEIRCAKYAKQILFLRDIRFVLFLSDLRHFGENVSEDERQSVHSLRYMRHIYGVRSVQERELNNLQQLILTPEVAGQAMKRLPFTDSTEDYMDLLCILLGRELQIRKENEKSGSVESEALEFFEISYSIFLASNDDDLRELALDLMSNLPVITGKVANFILRLAEDTTEESLRDACLRSISNADVRNSDIKKEFEAWKQSKVDIVRRAVEAYLEPKRIDLIDEI